MISSQLALGRYILANEQFDFTQLTTSCTPYISAYFFIWMSNKIIFKNQVQIFFLCLDLSKCSCVVWCKCMNLVSEAFNSNSKIWNSNISNSNVDHRVTWTFSTHFSYSSKIYFRSNQKYAWIFKISYIVSLIGEKIDIHPAIRNRIRTRNSESRRRETRRIV